MAVAIASSNTNTAIGASSVVVTKPTGLAEGDLMVAGVHHYWTGSDRQLNIAAGWTQISNDRIHNGGENNGTGMAVMYKVATAGDVAASDFTFTATDTAVMAACVLRITGISPTAPKDASNSVASDNGGSGGSFSFAGITPGFASCLLLLFAGTRPSSSGHSAQAIATSNPSWTELFDISTSFSLAYAIRPEITATGNVSYSINGANAGTDAIGCIVAIKPTTDVTVSPSVINASGAVLAPTISGGATVSPSVINATGAVLTPTVEEKPWRKRAKSSPRSWTARTKS